MSLTRACGRPVDSPTGALRLSTARPHSSTARPPRSVVGEWPPVAALRAQQQQVFSKKTKETPVRAPEKPQERLISPCAIPVGVPSPLEDRFARVSACYSRCALAHTLLGAGELAERDRPLFDPWPWPEHGIPALRDVSRPCPSRRPHPSSSVSLHVVRSQPRAPQQCSPSTLHRATFRVRP